MLKDDDVAFPTTFLPEAGWCFAIGFLYDFLHHTLKFFDKGSVLSRDEHPVVLSDSPGVPHIRFGGEGSQVSTQDGLSYQVVAFSVFERKLGLAKT